MLISEITVKMFPPQFKKTRIKSAMMVNNRMLGIVVRVRNHGG